MKYEDGRPESEDRKIPAHELHPQVVLPFTSLVPHRLSGLKKSSETYRHQKSFIS